MGIGRLNARSFENLHLVVGGVKIVVGIVGDEIAAFNQHGITAHPDETLSSFEDVGYPAEFDAGNQCRLQAVRGDDGRQGHQMANHRSYGIVGYELAAGSGNHHGVEHHIVRLIFL